eukprot:TRINITY_DN17015_c0_g1_i1.p1 TRINITY_DN17015_c0_g1~~TRINITY_DN17015_c0_g1_i1.p1  ORF type:complete len:118 (+),score=17.93 TRINITY_DN17015_c0_g1_i1:316-669(+)
MLKKVMSGLTAQGSTPKKEIKEGEDVKVRDCENSTEEPFLVKPDRLLVKPAEENWAVGDHVLAMFPETTTFYPAQVVGQYSRSGKRPSIVSVLFEGKEQLPIPLLKKHVLPFPTVDE